MSLRRNASLCESHMPAMASCHLVAFAAWHHLARSGPESQATSGFEATERGDLDQELTLVL